MNEKCDHNWRTWVAPEEPPEDKIGKSIWEIANINFPMVRICKELTCRTVEARSHPSNAWRFVGRDVFGELFIIEAGYTEV